MRIKCQSAEQASAVAVQIAVLAFEASNPVGMGFLHFVPGCDDNQKAEIKQSVGEFGLNFDYFQGRMMKLCAITSKDGLELDFGPYEPRADYQSWCGRYPTNRVLAETALAQLNDTQSVITD